ncbi:MAG: hypothetical protein HW391_1516, partial [Chloroflexi bacterium]|nr:hypothetical protein [Chloroflexota bacterium]
MIRASVSRSLLVVLASIAFIGAVLIVNGSLPKGDPGSEFGRGGPGAAAGPGAEGAEEQNEEAREQAEKAEKRREAYEAAVRAGTAGQKVPPNAAPAPGWAGEQPLDTVADDWEPAIAADPTAPWVY